MPAGLYVMGWIVRDKTGGWEEVSATKKCPNWCGRTGGEGGSVPTGDCQLEAMMQSIQETQRHQQGGEILDREMGQASVVLYQTMYYVMF